MTQTEEKPVVVKTEVDQESSQEDDTNQKLMAQIEYYFGDVNLPRDKFIKEECSKHDGWFPVDTLLKFNRVANLLKGISKENYVKTICEALKASALIDVNDEKLQIRRNPDCPLPEKDSEERTIYLKGFHRFDTTLDDLLAFFNKFEGCQSVIMRYYKEKTIKTEAELKKEKEEETGSEIKKEKEDDAAENGSEIKIKKEKEDDATENGSEIKKEKEEEKSEPKLVWVRKFKGSVFVVFKTVEQAQKVLDEPNLTFNGSVIQLKMWQAEYKALKTKEYQEKLASRKRKGDKKKEEGDDEEEEKPEMPKGALVKLLNIPDGYTREILKEKWFAALDKDKFAIAFIDFNKGDKNAVLRLDRENAAKEALELIPDKKLKMKDTAEGEEAVTSAMECVEGEEEVKYMEEIKKQRENKNKRKGGYGGRGGRGGKRRRRF